MVPFIDLTRQYRGIEEKILRRGIPSAGPGPDRGRGRQARTMKISNPPSPPFSKGGLGGFGKLFPEQYEDPSSLQRLEMDRAL